MPYYAQERRLNHRTTTTIEKKGRPRSKPADSTTFSDHTASLAADVDWEIQADCTRVGRRADSSRKLFKRNGTAVKDISFKKKRNVFDEDENWAVHTRPDSRGIVGPYEDPDDEFDETPRRFWTLNQYWTEAEKSQCVGNAFAWTAPRRGGPGLA